ncbi:septum site-determining divIVA domain protein [Lapidilactobacillus dextrinicus DSM 20335]|uniref:Septum site-determining divIVA domain protein n=1 Tax=Lapidilactobacillus dextrinicus DSM 20335 TaxID=1423738 RepID=A0A0R2BFX9_9LACO|nr:DivIVA domain-containing protein [Lapidilactobacillus dextrinicus]KRM78312.1 septum site-determining divIVA domain protein [Lapidilactobacillus dextrinicus DSM 20335]QFG47305.1 DivIVA domain-containing protein [Lapidilactobacillus dextrinicus]
MAVTPNDIQNQKFETHFRGYDVDQVQDFLDQVAADYNDLLLRNQQLEQSLKESQERVSYFTDLKDALNQSIIVAQDAGERVKANAHQEAELTKAEAQKKADTLVRDATNRSNQILTDATDRSRQLTVEAEELRKSTRVFHQKLQVLLESQLAMVNAPEWETLLNQAVVDPADARFTDNGNNADVQTDNQEVVDTVVAEHVEEVNDVVAPVDEVTDDNDDQPVFQHRTRDDQPEEQQEAPADNEADGVTIVFPDQDK